MDTKVLIASVSLMALLVPQASFAQGQKPEEQASAPTDDAAEENTDVSGDTILVTGYRARTTRSASRLDTPLEDVPINVQVLTGDVIDDLSLVTQRDALQFSAAVQDKSVRGFSTGEFFRNGFVHLSDSPGFTIERVEIIRGPTATLAGPVTPGGGINTITKKARTGSTFGEIGGFWGFSENSRDNAGTSIDINVGDLGIQDDHGPVAAFRFVAGFQRDTGFGAKVDNDIYAILPTLQLRPTATTVIDLEYYKYKVNTDRADRPFGIELTIPGATAGEEIPLALAYDIDPRASYFGSTTDINETVDDLTAQLTQTAMDERLMVSLTYNRHNRDFQFGPGNRPRLDLFYVVQPRTGAPSGTRNPDDFVLRRLTEDLLLTNQIDSLSGLVSFTPDSNRDHRFILGFDSFDQDQRLTIKRPRLSGTTSGFFFEFFEIEDVNDSNLDFNAGRSDLFFTPVLDRERRITQTSGFINYQGAFFNERLHILAGLTFSDIEIDETNLRATPIAEVRLSDSEEWLLQLGAVFEVVNGIKLYGNYSESQLPDLNDPDFSRAPPVRKGNQFEFGLKYSLLDDAISGTIGFFKIEETVRGLDNNRDVKAQGFDIDAFIQPVDNWTMVLSYANVDTEVVASGSATFVVGHPLVEEVPSKFAAWTKYDFTTGALDGLSLGGGFTWTGRRVRPTAGASQAVKTLNGQVLRYEPVTRLDVFANYGLEVFDDRRVELSLNLRNLTKDDNIGTVVPLVPLQGGVRPDGTPYKFDGSIEALFGVKFSF